MSLHVTNSNNQGEAYLVLSQGALEKTVNLTGNFDSVIDLSPFAPGPISLCFVYEDAGEIKVDLQLANGGETYEFLD